MNNLPLQPLVWDWSYGDGGKTNAVCRAKSPSHEYIIRLEAGGDCYVDYRKFDNDEDSDNRKDEPPAFDSIKAAQDWAQSTHYPSKMQPYVKPAPTWIDASERLPESECFYLVRLFDGHRDEHVFVILWWNAEHQQFLEWDTMCEPTHWMPIPEFSTMQNLHKEGGVIMNGFKLCTNCGKKRFMDSDRYHPMDGKGVCHECQLKSEADDD